MESFDENAFLEDKILMENDPRFILYNVTSGSVSSAYGAFIVLSIAFALAAILGLLFFGLAGNFNNGNGFGRKKRSADDYINPGKPAEENINHEYLLKILSLIHNLEAEIDELSNHNSKSEDCRKLTLCQYRKEDLKVKQLDQFLTFGRELLDQNVLPESVPSQLLQRYLTAEKYGKTNADCQKIYQASC